LKPYFSLFNVPSGDVGMRVAAINQANATSEPDTINLESGTSGTAKIHVISRDKQNRPSSAYYSMPKKMAV
jgi:hypothetical protein